MNCPHCEYFSGYNALTQTEDEGLHGSFYTLSVKLEREHHWDLQREILYACPKCGKTFISGVENG
jgi:ribosomal protein L37AE/L43A